jgi:predicted nucleic acid-binding protein
MTAALAMHRRCVVVTDDRKASRILNEQGVTLRTTLDLVRAWADQEAIQADVLGAAILDLRERGTYESSRNHPLREWWESAMRMRESQ